MIQYKLVPVDQNGDANGNSDETEQPDRSEGNDKQAAGYDTVDLKSINVDDILSTAPRELNHKCKAILAYLINAEAKVQQDSYRMVYDGGVIGSPLPDLLRWSVSDDRDEERPWDQMRFFKILMGLNVPKSIYGRGKYKLANVASKPVPIAVVKKRQISANFNNDKNEGADVLQEKRWKHLS